MHEEGTIELSELGISLSLDEIYDGNGVSWAYGEVAPRVFVRAPITIAAVQGGTAVLSKGPADGTSVVTVGAPLLLGAEAQIAGEE